MSLAGRTRRARFALPLFCLQHSARQAQVSMFARKSADGTRVVLLPIFTRMETAELYVEARTAKAVVTALEDAEAVERVTWRPSDDSVVDFRVVIDPGTEEASEHTVLTRGEFLSAEFV